MIIGLSECSAFWECILETMLNCLFVVFGFSALARFPPWLATVLVEGTQVAFFEAGRILSRLPLDLIGLLLASLSGGPFLIFSLFVPCTLRSCSRLFLPSMRF